MNRSRLLGAVAALALGWSGVAQSAVIYGGNFSGNDCGGRGGFGDCYAGITGTRQGPAEGFSPSIYKLNAGSGGAANGAQEFGSFPSITGSEFTVTLNQQLNTLSFTYAPNDATDPEIHYFTIKQANGFALFYDLTAPITSFTANLSTYFPNNPGFSHITFFDTRSTTVTVPEPASLALFGAGLLGLAAMRRRARAA